MSAHTPGPWHADDGDGEFYGVFAENGEPLAYLIEAGPSVAYATLPAASEMRPWQPGMDAAYEFERKARMQEHRANARLIAAAPMLAEALLDLVQTIGYGERPRVDAARAALIEAGLL